MYDFIGKGFIAFCPICPIIIKIESDSFRLQISRFVDETANRASQRNELCAEIDTRVKSNSIMSVIVIRIKIRCN